MDSLRARSSAVLGIWMQAVGATMGEQEFGNVFIQMSLYLVSFGY